MLGQKSGWALDSAEGPSALEGTGASELVC